MNKKILLALLIAVPAHAQRPMTARDLWSMGRVSNPALSPDGKQVAYAVTRYDLDTFKSKTEIFTVPTAGGEATHVATGNSPSWSPDGKQLAYIAAGKLHIGDRAIGEDVGGPIVWSRDGSKILVTATVKSAPDPTRPKSQARVYDELGYRHWDTWSDATRNHVLVVDVASGQTTDVTPGAYDAPPIALEGFQDYDISPDGTEVVFASNHQKQTMVGTGNDIWLSSNGQLKRLGDSDANENSPRYSPDGRYIAYIGMHRPGFEADKSELILYDRQTQQKRTLTPTLDLSVDYFEWAPDSKTIYFLAGDQIYHSVFKVGLNSAPVRVTEGTYNSGLAVAPDKSMVVARQSVTHPVDLYVLDSKGKVVRQLTHENDNILQQLSMNPAEPFWFNGADGAKVEGFIVKPPNFDASKKYPVVYLIHGGPQGVWADAWSYRWNPAMWASPGYVIATVNPRGSTGYGQQFTDEISRDWGGKVFTDVMNGIDYVTRTYPFVDTARVAAAGGSYGGYMINWINGHTKRFKALIDHDGVFDTRSMGTSTEELWFNEWEFGGPPWVNPGIIEKWNPANFAQNMRTPTLVIHGALDYRVPLEQGLMAFTTLRRQGVDARLLYFPDEGHWVLKPQNAFVWWDEMLGWLNKYIGKPNT